MPFGLATSGSQFVRSIVQVLERDHPESVATGEESEMILNKTVQMFVDDGTIYTGEE